MIDRYKPYIASISRKVQSALIPEESYQKSPTSRGAGKTKVLECIDIRSEEGARAPQLAEHKGPLATAPRSISPTNFDLVKASPPAFSFLGNRASLRSNNVSVDLNSDNPEAKMENQPLKRPELQRGRSKSKVF